MSHFNIVQGILLLLPLCFSLAEEDSSLNGDDDAELLELAISMTAVAGGKVLLPCNITPPNVEDDVALILWYKDESKSPLYSIDGRRSSIHRAHRFVAESLRERAFLDTAVHPAILQIEELLEKDEGVYRCRVDFKRARTRNSDIILTIIVPPKKPIIMDQNGEILQSLIGPFNEDERLFLNCEAEGGKPAPNVTWWRESVLLDDTFETTSLGVVKNTLVIPQLQRHDLMAVLTCQASNNNISVPSSSAVTVDMNFRPKEVQIANDRKPMSARKSVDLICRATGSRPPAMLTWWKGSTKLTRTKDRISIDGYVTTSILTFTPSSEDSGRHLTCKAENPLIPGMSVEDEWKLEVHYVPQLTLRLGSKLNQDSIQENNDVYFECNIRANPWVNEIGWKFGHKEILTNVSYGVIVSNQSLVLQKVNRGHRGYYTCTGTNTEGQGESNRVFLRVQYAPVCKANQKLVYGVARHESVKVYCEVDADPELSSFRWEFNNSMETMDVITTESDGRQSTATYIPRSENDYGTLLCWAQNSVGLQQEPCVYSIIPAGPPDPPENCTFTNKTETSLALECVEGYDGGLPQFFVMEVHDSGQQRIRANVSTDVPVLFAQGLPAGSSFVLVIYSVNIKGRSQSVILRASTMPAPVRHTQKEAMWQFNMSPVLLVLIGVVLLLVLLAILIVAFMKEKSRRGKLNGETTEALTYDNLKKQNSMPKDGIDKIFTYTMQEEKCPDIIPEANTHVSGSSDHQKLTDSEHMQWKSSNTIGPTEARVSLNSVCYSRQSPEKTNVCSMKINEFYSPGTTDKDSSMGSVSYVHQPNRVSSPPHLNQQYGGSEGLTHHSTFQAPNPSLPKQVTRLSDSLTSTQRNNPLSLVTISPPLRDGADNMQTEV